MNYKTGTIVKARERDWIVLASEDKDVLRLKPLDGREDDEVGIYLPLTKKGDVSPSQFHPPSLDDLGSIRSARLLFDASRLSLRSASGPFRCAAKLGFRPRSYQMVPLIMALKQKNPVRLLIADDVGVGKTVESLLIAKELLERREIKRFAVLCPPHLCEQWQAELKEKFQLDAVVIRTGTQASLDRQVPREYDSIFQYFPYQVISIDYIKSDGRFKVFANQAPELVIVDEAHSCAKPAGHRSSNQQLRHRLVKEISKKENQHLVLVTATPHSGKEAEFQSLIGLLKPEFESFDWEEKESNLSSAKRIFRQELAKHFVQRKRKNIAKWMDETTPFPERISNELPYSLSLEYQALYDELLLYTSGMMNRTSENKNEQRFRYWSALALLRGIMSSPQAGKRMLENRIQTRKNSQQDEQIDEIANDDNFILEDNPNFERLESADDELPTPLLEKGDPKNKDIKAFEKFAKMLTNLQDISKDNKLAFCTEQIKKWHKENFSPIIFCRFIETAKYVANSLSKSLGSKVLVECVTSEDPDEVRRERIDQMASEISGKKLRVLVATDCLSEGINLQNYFDAVMHYDLPWNPNRLEQREGRVDRFGQMKDQIQTCLLYGQDNPMDQIVLKVLFRKAKRIRSSIGVSIPFPEDSKVFLDTIFQAVLAEADKKKRNLSQPELFEMEEFIRSDEQLDLLVKQTKQKEAALRSIFAQATIKAQDIEQDLVLTDEAVGKPETVARFVNLAFAQIFGANIELVENPKAKNDLSFKIHRSNFPEKMRSYLEYAAERTDSKKSLARISFKSPVQESYTYWGRNHDAVESLCRIVLSESLKPQLAKENFSHSSTLGSATSSAHSSTSGSATSSAHSSTSGITTSYANTVSRASVVLSNSVQERIVIFVLRARHVIEDIRANHHLVAEEILSYGLSGINRTRIPNDAINNLMDNPNPAGDLDLNLQKRQLERELENLETLRPSFDALAYERAEALIEQHERYHTALGERSKSDRYRIVEPVIPLDILGIYIFLPANSAGSKTERSATSFSGSKTKRSVTNSSHSGAIPL